MIKVGGRVLAVDGHGFGTVISINSSGYTVRHDTGEVLTGSSDDIIEAFPDDFSFTDRGCFSNEESARYGKYLRRCYR